MERGGIVVCLIRIRCRRCGRRFEICRSCYRGHVHCSRKCSAASRYQSIRAARRKYRQQPEIMREHRERERRRREALGRVGDQGSPAGKGGAEWEEKPGRVECAEARVSEGNGAEPVVIAKQNAHQEVADMVAGNFVGTVVAASVVGPPHLCAFCGRAGYVVARFLRRGTGRRPAVRRPNQRR